MRTGIFSTIVALSLLSGCCCHHQHPQPPKNGHVTSGPEGRWLSAVIQVGSPPSSLDLGDPTAGYWGLPLSALDETLNLKYGYELVVQHQFNATYPASRIIVGPRSPTSAGAASFDCSDPRSPLVIEKGFGYVVGNWRLTRGRYVRATAVSHATPSATDCNALVAAYDPAARILYVTKGSLDRVFSIAGRITLLTDKGERRNLEAGHFLEVDDQGGVATEPTVSTGDPDLGFVQGIAGHRQLQW